MNFSHVQDACSHTCTQANALTPSDPTHAHTRTAWSTQHTYTRRACTHARPQNAREQHMHAHTLGCMEACAIRGDVRFVVLRRSSHAMAHTHLSQHLFAVVAQLLVRDEDDRILGLRTSTDGKTCTLHAHEHVRSAHDMVVVRPSCLYSFYARCL